MSPSGAFTYTIPIAVPPGTAGMEPRLSLNYSSQSGNGLLGVGWSLGGLSAITRCPVDPAPKTSVRVTFTATDRFCLDGQKLVAISGTYGANGAEYRTERESFAKVISSGAAGSGPASFTVRTKAGLIMEYGLTSDARILADGRPEVRVWALNKVSDTAGNYFTVAYTPDVANADYVPARIDYTGNTTAGVSPYNKMEFVYESRPDASTGYAAGVRVGQTQRLTHVLVYAGAILVSDYALSYGRAPVTQRSRLVSLTRCAGDSNCLAPTTFTWLDGEGASYAPDTESVTPTGSVNDTHFTLGDMNADGRTDALVLKMSDTNSGVFHPYLGQIGGALASGQQLAMDGGYDFGGATPANSRLVLLNKSGTGRDYPFLLMVGFGQQWSTNAEGTLLNTACCSPPFVDVNAVLSSSWFIPAEYNSDGQAEWLEYVKLTSGSYLSTDYDGFKYAGIDSSTHFFVGGDVSGDGLTDALLYDPVTGKLHMWVSGGEWHNKVPDQPLPAGGSPLDRWFLLGDINGDGLGDLVLHTPANGLLQTWLAKGDGTFVAGSISNFVAGGLPADTWFQMVDINADGRADVVKYNPASGNLTYALSLGDGGFDSPASVYLGAGPLPTPHLGPSPTTQWFSPADINGDGVLDWVRYDPAWGRIKVNLGQGGVPDQLLAVTDGLGAATRFTYKPLTDASVYTKGTGAVYPEQDVQNAMQVVASAESDNGIGGFIRNTYTYAGLKAKVNGGGMLGFKTMSVRNEQTGITTVTEYRQDSPYTGQVAKVTQTTAGGIILRKVENTYNQQTTAYNGFTYLSRSIEQGYDLNGSQINKVQIDTGVDGYGNPTSIVVNSGGGYSKTTTNVYDNVVDPDRWFLGRLRRSTVNSITP